MGAFTLTQLAKEDLKSIARFTEERWGRMQRNLYLKQFDDIFQLLADSPSIGAACDFIKSGYRKFPKGSHIVYYKVGADEQVIIIRVLHKNMDVNSSLVIAKPS
ncbi:MAG: type II toxin-antitoxin system RelE/ParE family toxin [Gammaproteobacteria bacterium]|nr:type II toxin-antitoxin system RelE/ParE family toxin [Gammaproteobacteria bacterium]MCY4283213.1 type II toxin-antitoxin system RelE/ParE family toxin [Gammaproteobacteria bacterium]